MAKGPRHAHAGGTRDAVVYTREPPGVSNGRPVAKRNEATVPCQAPQSLQLPSPMMLPSPSRRFIAFQRNRRAQA